MQLFGEGNGNPLQSSYLENPMDGGAWWAAVHQVSKSQTRLSDFTFTFHFHDWRREWQPTPVFLPGESQGRGSLVGCRLWGRTESDTTEATQQQQRQHAVSGDVIWCSHCGKNCGGSSKNLKKELLYNLAIPLLGIHLKETKTQILKDLYTLMFITALFTAIKI